MGPNSPAFSICMEGWRFIAHSYAIVSQCYSLELLKRTGIRLFHRDLPFYGADWQAGRGLFRARQEQGIAAIPAPPPATRIDAVIRCSYPYDLSPAGDAATHVIATSELRIVPERSMKDGATLAARHAADDVTLITCSEWSRQGFLASGADPGRLCVVPTGVDPAVVCPPDPEARSALRRQLRLDGCFAFLNVGAMTPAKGIGTLLTAFAVVAGRHPEARLILKGLDPIYRSDDRIARTMAGLPARAAAAVRPRLIYVGQSLSFDKLAALYHAADAYVSPYQAEAFNIPVLEAAACGLPVICTAGGPTDEFVTGDFGRFIASELRPAIVPHGPNGAPRKGFRLVPDGGHLATLMTDMIGDSAFAAGARRAGPGHVRRGWTWSHAVDKLLAVVGAPGHSPRP